ncbi:sn-glycerol-3-phosphate transporter [Parendozoicomonas haliclonae]|uniref:Sn-glycerol-3-phosphate transporter n=1 Tax=Parendozoicomonas haliclonae TaxID=1960125 RepID=A0A1X7ASD2_9GAMM|nr:sn-glycerol-3-phosphate transporter [Parendozoicomonas haliclonae]SMA50337.1 hypothetical protein EHSB41UT_04134 [Parendozoicomonas haliclonae]
MLIRDGWQVLALVFFSLCSYAEEQPELSNVSYAIEASFHTIHFHHNDEHNDRQNLIGIERRDASTVMGATVFKNSFNQDSQYIYWGKRFPLQDSEYGLRARVTFGLLHGYRGEYKNKIPLNRFGVAPAILPSLGYTTRYIEGDVVLLGINALLFTISIPFAFSQ